MIDKDTIIKLARETGFDAYPVIEESDASFDAVKRLTQAAYKLGLEDAAVACRQFGATLEHDNSDCFAEEIRALMKETP